MLMYGGNQHKIVNYPLIKNKFLKKEKNMYIYIYISALQLLDMEYN